MVSGPMLDQITQLLHNELSKKSRQLDTSKRPASTARARGSQQQRTLSDPGSALRARIEKLTMSGVTDESVLIRSAVEFLLQQEFGGELANSPSFQEVTEQITSVILQNEAFATLLLSALK